MGEVGGETPIYTSSLEESSQEVQLGCLLCHSEFRMYRKEGQRRKGGVLEDVHRPDQVNTHCCFKFLAYSSMPLSQVTFGSKKV